MKKIWKLMNLKSDTVHASKITELEVPVVHAVLNNKRMSRADEFFWDTCT